MSTTKTAAIAALTVIGGASIGTGVVVAKGSVGMPYCHFLFEDDNYKDKAKQEYKDKYGEAYRQYLSGVDTLNNREKFKVNDKWWEWSYYNRYTPNISKTKDKFSGVNTPEELKNKCTESYKETAVENGNITSDVSDSNLQNKFLESNIWLFCSPLEEKMRTISDENKTPSEYTVDSLYGDSEKAKKDLVSVLSESKGNDWFWNRQRNKYKSPFNKDDLQIVDGDVKRWCGEAYKDFGSRNSYTKESVFKWCSLSGKAPAETKQSK